MEIINHEHKLRIRIFIKRLQSEEIPRLGVFNNVAFEIWLIFLFYIFATENIHSTLKHSSLYKHTSDFLEKSWFSHSISSAYMNVLRLFRTAYFSKDLINLFPFSINQWLWFFELNIYVMSLAITRR